MGTVALIVGAGLIALSVADLAWTTLSAGGGGGHLTARVSHWLWEVIRAGGAGGRRHRLMQIGGLLVVGTIILIWVGLLWLGWTLVFAAAEEAVVVDGSGEPVSWWARVYFAGTTVSTLGPGDVVAGTAAWRFATALSSLSGLLFITLAITYLLPIISAVSQRRMTAMQITSLGDDPYEIALRSGDPVQARELEAQFRDLAADVQRLAQQHLAYPALHFFHDVDRENAGPVQIAVLDEALTMIDLGIVEGADPISSVGPARQAVASVLGTLTTAYIEVADDPPPSPDLDRLDGVETVDRETFHARLADIADRRRALLAFVEDDGWTWDHVYPAQDEEDDPRGRGARGGR